MECPAGLDHADVYRNGRRRSPFIELGQRFGAGQGLLSGARQYIPGLRLLAEHQLSRVEQAIAAGRNDQVVTVERDRVAPS